MKELCIRHYCMCTNPWKGSLPSTFKTASLLKDMQRVLREHSLAALILLSLFRRNVLGLELFRWLPHDCGTFYLLVSRMPKVNSHSNQAQGLSFSLIFSFCFSVFHFCCYNFHVFALCIPWQRRSINVYYCYYYYCSFLVFNS